MISLFFIIFSGIVGYVVGALKSFREAKQKAYEEILPPILQMAYNPSKADEGEFGKALCKLWLYANKKIAKKMDNALYILHDRSRGDLPKTLQEVVADMRKDIQVMPWQKVKPEDVHHLYTQIVKVKDTKNENN